MVKKPRQVREKKVKSTFLQDPLDSIMTHLGLAVDKMKLNDWADLGIIGALAYLGYDLSKDWRGMLIGPIGYKLATTMGGTPPVSQIAGLTTLAVLGIASGASTGLIFNLPEGTITPIPGTNAEETEKAQEENRPPDLTPNLAPMTDVWSNIAGVHCSAGYILDWDLFHGWYCKKARQPT